ncbi:hypothetical protein [Chryseobacterium culicis]
MYGFHVSKYFFSFVFCITNVVSLFQT